MKVFLVKILTVLSPFVIGLILLTFVAVPKEYKYTYRKNVDCNTSWPYYRINENNTPVDIAFLGTSHTGCGINDSLISRLLSQDKKIHAANLAYCTKGRNIQFPLLLDLVKTKKPDLVIIEIMEYESRDGHKDFGIIAGDSLVYASLLNFNNSSFNDLINLFKIKLDYFRKSLTKTAFIETPKNYESNFYYTPFPFYIDTNSLSKHEDYKVKKQQKERKKFESSNPSKFFSPLEELVNLANSQNIEIKFLYIPAYGAKRDLSYTIEYANQLAEVLIPPDSIFTNPKNWVDSEHLNYWGSKELSSWVAKQVSKQTN